MDGGDLWDHISQNPVNEEALLNTWTLHLAKALVYMHAKRLLHRDVKPLNVLLTATNRSLKLGDFGLTTRVGMGIKHGKGIGNLAFSAPELFLRRNYGLSADVYSFGLTLYYIFYSREPYKPEKFPLRFFVEETAKLILNDESRPPLEGKPIDSLIRSCWPGKASERLRMREVLSILEEPEGRQKFPRLSD